MNNADGLTLFELPEETQVLTPVAAVEPKQLATMHARHGATEGQVCGTCNHLCRGRYNTTVYFKCELYTPWTHGPGTDWRKKWQACGKWERL